MAIRPAVKDGQAGEYNGLRDSNLGHFFSRPHVFNHLRKMGLVTPRGKIVTEREWKNQNRVVSKRVSSLDGSTNHPYGNAMSSLPESWRSPNSSVASFGNSWNSKRNSTGGRAKTRRQHRLANIESEEDSGSYQSSGGDSSRTTRSSRDSGDSDNDGHDDNSNHSSDYESNEANERNTRASSRSESASPSLRDKLKRQPSSQTQTIPTNLTSYRGCETNLMFSEHNHRRKVDRSSSSISRPASSSSLSLASLECVRDRLTGVGCRQGLRLLRSLRRHSDVLPVALVGEPYLHSLPPDTPVFRPPVTDAQIQSRLYRSPSASAGTPRPANADAQQLLRADVTLTLQHTGRPAHLRLVQHTSPHTALTVYTGHLDTNEEFDATLSPFSAGSLGLVLLVDDIVVMRLNGCCEHRYSLGAMLDGPSGRLRLLSATTQDQPCVKCQARRKRKKFRSRWSIGKIFSGIRKEESADSSLNRNKSMSCSAVFHGGESTKQSQPSKFSKRYSNRIGIINNQTHSTNQTFVAKEHQSNRLTHSLDVGDRPPMPNSAASVPASATSPETSARSGHGSCSLSDDSFYDKEYQRASVDKEGDGSEQENSGSKTSVPPSEDLPASGEEDTNVEEEIEEYEIDEDEVDEEVDEEEQEVLEEDYSSSDGQEKKKSSTSNSGSIRILGS